MARYHRYIGVPAVKISNQFTLRDGCERVSFLATRPLKHGDFDSEFLDLKEAG